MADHRPTTHSLLRAALAAVALGGLVLLLAAAGCEDDSPPSQGEAEQTASAAQPEDALAAARAFYDSRPYFQRPHPFAETPAGLADVRSETCGTCHEAIYAEWKLSTHAHAWEDDAQFQAELAKSRGEHAGASDGERSDVGWMCVNCHTPTMNQLPKLVVDLEDGDIGKPVYVDNPRFDPKMQDEAIGCATCHVRDGVVYGPFGDTDAPHPTAKADRLLDEEVCVRCHQAEAHWPSKALACFFTTGQEFQQTEYADQGQTCQDCHMPTVERHLADAYTDRPKRQTRRHWFGGSLIPKKPEYAADLAELEPVYGTGVEMALIAPGPHAELRDLTARWGEVEVDTPCADAPPDDGEAGCRTLAVRVTNANAGHDFPTGDPERHADVVAVARDADGNVVARTRARLGSRYAWWPDIALLYDTRLAAGAHWDIPLDVPADAGPLTVEVTGDKYRMYPEAFDYHELEGEYVRGRDFHRSTWRVPPGGDPELVEIVDDWGRREMLEPEK